MANVFKLVGKLVLEGQENLKQGLEEVGKESQKTEQSFKNLQKVTTPLGIAMTAAGVAGLKLASDALKLNAQMAQTAITVGSTTDEMRDLVLETTNVTFGIQSVISTMELLARAGVRGTQNLHDAATAFDTLGDATGTSGEAMADALLPAFKNMGVAIPTTAAELDAFTYLVKNTLVDIQDFASAMTYAAMYGENLNLTIEDMVAILAALEEKGITGSAVTRLFRTAVTQAAEGSVTLVEALNLTQDEIDAFKGELKDATGLTQKYADAANTQYGLMDKLKQMWSELALRIGTFLEPMQGALVGMLAVGAALVALPMIIPKVITAIRALSVAMRSLSLVGGALGLVGIIATIGVGLYDLIRRGKDWTDSVNRWTDALDSANERLATLEEQGRGASEEAETLRLMIDDLTESLKKYSEVGDDNEVTAYNLTDAIKKLSDATKEYYDLMAVTEGDLGVLEGKSWMERLKVFAQYEATMADAAGTTLELLEGIEREIRAMDDLSEAYEDAAGNAEILSMIEAELADRIEETANTVYDDAIEALQEYYGIQEEKSKSLLELYQDEVEAQKTSLNNQLKAERDYTRNAISEYQRQYNERIKLLDKETDAAVRALQDQLDLLDETEEADEEASLRQAIEDEWSRIGKAEAAEALNDFLLDKQRRSLQDQISDVQNAANDQKDIWAEELDAQIDNEEQKLAVVESKLQSQLDALETAVDDKKLEYQRDYDNATETYDSTLIAYQTLLDNQATATEDTWDEIAETIKTRAQQSAQDTLAAWASLSAGQAWTAPAGAAGVGMGARFGLGGSVKGYSQGGPIVEDTLLVGMKSGAYAMAHKGESVTPSGGGVTVNINHPSIRSDLDIVRLTKSIERTLYKEKITRGNYGA